MVMVRYPVRRDFSGGKATLSVVPVVRDQLLAISSLSIPLAV